VEFIALADAQKDKYWVQPMNDRMLDAVAKERSGEDGYGGATEAYTKLITGWYEWFHKDEAGSAPFSDNLAALFAESYLTLGLPRVDDVYDKAFSTYLGKAASLRASLVEEGCRHYLTGESSLLIGDARERNLEFIAKVARVTGKISTDPELLALVQPIVKEADERSRVFQARWAEKEERDRKAEEARRAETQRILEALKGD
jgi:hypothetical protein